MNKYVFTLIDLEDDTEFMTIVSSFTNMSPEGYYLVYVKPMVQAIESELNMRIEYRVDGE